MEKVLAKISKEYEVEKISLLHRVDIGYLSNNYILEDNNQKYFLKQYRYKDLDRIKEVHRVKLFFADGGIPIILPIKTKEGNYFFISDDFYYSLFPFIDGKIIERKDLSITSLTSIAETLAKIHLLSKDGPPFDISKQLKTLDTEAFFEKADHLLKIISKKSLKTEFDLLSEENIRLKMKLVEKNKINWEHLNLKDDHLIHGDYHNSNLFFDDNDQVKYVFDLEKTKLAPRTNEVLRSVVFCCFDDGYTNRDNFEKAKLYIKRYHTIYPLDKNEIESNMQYFYINRIHNLWVEEEHYLKGNKKVDHFMQNRLKGNRYFDQNLGVFINILQKAAS